MKDLLEVETPTPPEEIKQVDRRSKVPDYTVPIMFEITKRDIELAATYGDIHNCIVATALKRLGYKIFAVGSPSVIFLDENISSRWFRSDDILQNELCNGRNYKPEIVGKQIILYPV